VDSVYGEVLVPIFGAANARPGLQKLELSLADRFDLYSDVGSTNNPKVGVNWSPVKGLSFRGAYGTSFRAPGLVQIRSFTNGGRGGLFVQNYSDPTNGGAQRVGVALSAANPDLKPETATTKSLGFDWDLPLANKTKLSVNFFDITYENQIATYLSDLTLLNREAQFAGTNIIQRNPSSALQAEMLATYPIRGVPPAAWSLFVDGRSFNLGKSISQGVDFQSTTQISTDNWGDFVLGLGGTVFTKYDVAVTPSGQATDQLNKINNPLRFKMRASGSWSYERFQTNLTVNHQNAYTNDLVAPAQTVDSYTTVDLRVAYALPGLGKDASLALGVVNLFDTPPPFVNLAQSVNGGGGFDPTLANPVGRTVSVSLNVKF
jgi:iron complex outermembrane receptor protein